MGVGGGGAEGGTICIFMGQVFKQIIHSNTVSES